MRNEIQFLNLDDILQIHQDTIENEGGSDGVRDIALIDSAVAAPKASFAGEYLHGDLAAMTAALMFALISNHGFVDGNKRVGTLAALVFRDINGESTFPSAQELEEVALSIARSQMNRDELADWWRRWTPVRYPFSIVEEENFPFWKGDRFVFRADIESRPEEKELNEFIERYLWDRYDNKAGQGRPPAALALHLYLKNDDKQLGPTVRADLAPFGKWAEADKSCPREDFEVTIELGDLYRQPDIAPVQIGEIVKTEKIARASEHAEDWSHSLFEIPQDRQLKVLDVRRYIAGDSYQYYRVKILFEEQEGWVHHTSLKLGLRFEGNC